MNLAKFEKYSLSFGPQPLNICPASQRLWAVMSRYMPNLMTVILASPWAEIKSVG